MSIFVHFHSLLDYFNVSLILELNSEFRDFKLWDQKLQFNGFVSSSGIISLGFCDIIQWFFYLRVPIHILIIFLWDWQILYKWVPELTKTVNICSKIYYRLMILS